MSAPASRSFELDMPAVASSAAEARDALTELLRDLDVDVEPARIVVSEAIANVVVHAYRDREVGRVRVSGSLAGDILTLTVADDGVGMAPRRDSPGLGMGLPLIGRLAQTVEVQSGDGTRLVVRLRLGPARED